MIHLKLTVSTLRSQEEFWLTNSRNWCFPPWYLECWNSKGFFLGSSERMQQLVRWAVSLFGDPVMSWALTANAAIKNKTKQNHPTDRMPFSKGENKTKKLGCVKITWCSSAVGGSLFFKDRCFAQWYLWKINVCSLGLSSDRTLPLIIIRSSEW